MTEKALEIPKPITIEGKDGSKVTIENRGGLWVIGSIDEGEGF